MLSTSYIYVVCRCANTRAHKFFFPIFYLLIEQLKCHLPCMHVSVCVCSCTHRRSHWTQLASSLGGRLKSPRYTPVLDSVALFVCQLYHSKQQYDQLTVVCVLVGSHISCGEVVFVSASDGP